MVITQYIRVKGENTFAFDNLAWYFLISLSKWKFWLIQQITKSQLNMNQSWKFRTSRHIFIRFWEPSPTADRSHEDVKCWQGKKWVRHSGPKNLPAWLTRRQSVSLFIQIHKKKADSQFFQKMQIILFFSMHMFDFSITCLGSQVQLQLISTDRTNRFY